MAILIFGTVPLPYAAAQFQAGGVSLPGDPSWFAGKGLNKGDFFRYTMCHVDYKECSPFEMNIWIKGDTKSGTEEKWLTEVVVYDGNKVIKGEMDLGKLAPEPSGGSTDLSVYRGAFKSSIVWLSAFATGYEDSTKGPKKFSAKSWGKIGNIGGEQIIPTAIEKVTVKAGTYDTVLMTWKTGGAVSKVWLVDGFPFPIKALTYTHVSTGIPPTEYKFELLEYKQNVQQSPFTNIVPDPTNPELKNCPKTDSLTNSIQKSTKNFSYQIHAFYTPEFPVQGCPMKWQFDFLNKYHDTEYLNQVQYDLLVVDDKLALPPLRSIATEQGYDYLYSPSGLSTIDMIVKEPPGIAHYLVYIYGLAPPGIVPSSPLDYLVIDLPIAAKTGTSDTAQNIPIWIKNNAKWWADGSIDDNSFVQGIQFLIKSGIMKITPPPQDSGSTGSNPDSFYN